MHIAHFTSFWFVDLYHIAFTERIQYCMNNDVIVYQTSLQSQYNIVNALFDLCDNEKPIFTLKFLRVLKSSCDCASYINMYFQFYKCNAPAINRSTFFVYKYYIICLLLPIVVYLQFYDLLLTIFIHMSLSLNKSPYFSVYYKFQCHCDEVDWNQYVMLECHQPAWMILTPTLFWSICVKWMK